MSLLLEALKKAEKAKEEAQRRARGEPAGRSPLRSRPQPPQRRGRAALQAGRAREQAAS